MLIQEFRASVFLLCGALAQACLLLYKPCRPGWLGSDFSCLTLCAARSHPEPFVQFLSSAPDTECQKQMVSGQADQAVFLVEERLVVSLCTDSHWIVFQGLLLLGYISEQGSSSACHKWMCCCLRDILLALALAFLLAEAFCKRH